MWRDWAVLVAIGAVFVVVAGYGIVWVVWAFSGAAP
jgi:hypothetical protein